MYMFIVVFVVSLYTFKFSTHESSHVYLKEFPSIYVKKFYFVQLKTTISCRCVISEKKILQ